MKTEKTLDKQHNCCRDKVQHSDHLEFDYVNSADNNCEILSKIQEYICKIMIKFYK